MNATELRERVCYDPLTGLMTWRKSNGSRAVVGGLIGTNSSKGYLTCELDHKHFKIHRLAWLYMTGQWPNGQIDHIDGDKKNNRIANLREASNGLNKQNMRRPRRDNKTGFLGVSQDGGRFRAEIGVEGANVYLGMFATPQAAHAAYIEAKRRLHPGCTL